MFGAGIMIDRYGTLDRDDAIWADPDDDDGWELAVHIACASDVVRPGTAADLKAARQAETIYLPDRTVPMLGRQAEAAATLAPGRDCPAITVTWRLLPDGTPSGARIREGSPGNLVPLDYAEATAAIKDDSHPQHGAMSAAHAAASVMLARRVNAGALAIYDLIHGVASDGDGGLRKLAAAERCSAYMIVAEFMVAANTLIAEYCVMAGIPALFRAHEAPAVAPSRDRLMNELHLAISGDGGEWRREGARQRLDHLLRPASYSVHAAEHFGLRLPWYCHATSPLRRYADLVLQRQILAVLRGSTPPYEAAQLEGIADGINGILRGRRERRAERHKERAAEQRRAELAAGPYRELDADQFYRLLKLAAKEERCTPQLEAELARRVNAETVMPREAHLILTVPGPEWDASRAAVIRWLELHPEHAVSVVAIHAVSLGMKAPLWEEKPTGTVQQPLFSVRAGITGDGGIRWTAARIARRKDAARQQAALSLLATLAGQPDPSATEPPPARMPTAAAQTSSSPVSALNELCQAGVLRGLDWEFGASGEPHAPQFACTATARRGDGLLFSSDGTAATKREAKAAAAHRLLAELERRQAS